MKKLAFLMTSLMLLGTTSIFAEEQTYHPEYRSPEKPKQNVAYTIKKVAGPAKETISAFTITYPYASESVDKAIVEKLKTEGLSYSKAKNKFYAYKGVKYNALWTRTFDMYVAITGSKSSSTIHLVLSTGYDNYIDDDDPEENEKISKWLVSLEHDIQTYLHNEKIADAEKEVKDAEKEVDKIKKDRTKLEKSHQQNEDKTKAFEAKRTIPDENNINTVDTKVLEKEQKQANKFADTDKKIHYDLDENAAKLKQAEENLSEKKATLSKLKSNRP